MFFYFSSSVFARRLQYLRKSKELTLEQLGEVIGSTRATISNLETETKKPSLDMVIKLADYFQVSIDYLVGRTDDSTFHHTKSD